MPLRNRGAEFLWLGFALGLGLGPFLLAAERAAADKTSPQSDKEGDDKPDAAGGKKGAGPKAKAKGKAQP